MADNRRPTSEQKDLKTTPAKSSENDPVAHSSSDDDSDDEMRCDLCDKAFSGVKTYEQHIKGRKHAKAAKRQRMKAKLVDVENDETTKADFDILPSFEPYETCESCGKEFGGPESFQQHLASKAHKRKIVEHAVLEQVKEAGNLNMDRLKEIYKLESGKNAQKGDAGAYNVMSNELTEQVPGSAHDKSFDDLSEDAYECKPCGNVFSGLAPFIQHLKSKRHSKVEKEMEFYEMLKLNSAGKAKSSPKSEMEKLMSSLQIMEGVITCDLCKASMSGYETALSHLKGKKHSGKLETQEWKKEHRKKDSLQERKSQETQLPSVSNSDESDSGEKMKSSTDDKSSDKSLLGRETSL